MYLRNLRNLIWVYCNQILSHKRYLYRNQNFNQKECMWFTCTFLINILIIKNWLTINDVVMLLLFYDRIFFVCLDWYDIPKKKKVVERFPIRQFLYFSLCCIRKIIIIISEAIISEHLCLHNVCLFVCFQPNITIWENAISEKNSKTFWIDDDYECHKPHQCNKFLCVCLVGNFYQISFFCLVVVFVCGLNRLLVFIYFYFFDCYLCKFHFGVVFDSRVFSFSLFLLKFLNLFLVKILHSDVCVCVCLCQHTCKVCI